MSRRELLLEMRTTGKLKGQRPCFVSLKYNTGNIYNEGSGSFIMSLRDTTLHFQKIGTFFMRLKPNGDFSINTERFKEYALIEKKLMNTLYLYDKEGNFLEVFYNKGTEETFSTEENIKKIISILTEKGLKKI